MDCQVSEKETNTMTIAEVVIERKSLLIESKRKDWEYHVHEKIERRLKELNDFIVDYFLAHYKGKK